jgi:hypothetical protein
MRLSSQNNKLTADIATAIPMLDESGGNWGVFKLRLQLALEPQGLYHLFVQDPNIYYQEVCNASFHCQQG